MLSTGKGIKDGKSEYIDKEDCAFQGVPLLEELHQEEVRPGLPP